MNNILITGGAGYIGSHLTKKLCDLGHTVSVIDNLSTGTEKAVDKRAEFLIDNIRNLNSQNCMIDPNIDTIFHLAASMQVEESICDPLKYYENNVSRLMDLLRWTRDPCFCKCRPEIRRIIFSSSCSVYGDSKYPLKETNPTNPVSPYAKTKLMCDQILEDFSKANDMQIISLRYFNVAGASIDGSLGNYNEKSESLIPKIIRLALKNEPIEIYGNDYLTEDGTCIRDYIHVEDVVNANICCLDYLNKKSNVKSGFKVFNIGSEKGFSVKEVVCQLERILGRNLKVIYKERRKGDPAVARCYSTKMKMKTGWYPKYSDLKSILCSEINWIKKCTQL